MNDITDQDSVAAHEGQGETVKVEAGETQNRIAEAAGRRRIDRRVGPQPFAGFGDGGDSSESQSQKPTLAQSTRQGWGNRSLIAEEIAHGFSVRECPRLTADN